MRQTQQEQKVADIAKPVIEDLGFDLFWVKIGNENGMQTVSIMAEDPKTKRLGIDDCTKISKALSATLDVEDPIKSKYRLEVSSPGIDRMLVREEDFARYKGFTAKLETETPTLTGQRRFHGKLLGAKDGMVMIKTDEGEAELEFASLIKAKLVLTDSLMKASAANKLNDTE